VFRTFIPHVAERLHKIGNLLFCVIEHFYIYGWSVRLEDAPSTLENLDFMMLDIELDETGHT
jgi:hypothetical protein